MLIKFAVDQCIPHLKWLVEYKSYDEGYISLFYNYLFPNPYEYVDEILNDPLDADEQLITCFKGESGRFSIGL